MHKGFTLVEILVSVAIFTVVVTTALGALLAMSTADRKAETLKTVITNLDFAIDSMSRALRTGNAWGCDTTNTSGTSCQSGGNEIIFTPSGGTSGAEVEYRLDNTNASICGQTGTIGCIEKQTFNGTSWSGWAPITSPDVVLTGSPIFHMIGAAAGSADNIQPKVIITLTGYVQVTPTQTSQFSMQTTVTQRLYDQ